MKEQHAQSNSRIGAAGRGASRLVVTVSLSLLLATPSTGRQRDEMAQQGQRAFNAGRYSEALAAFREATANDPADLQTWRDLAMTLVRLDRRSDSVDVWEMLLKIEPDDPALLNALAEDRMELGQFAQARSLYRRSLEIDPSQARIRLALGDAILEAGDLPLALAEYGRVLELSRPESDPDFSLALTRYTRANEALEMEAASIVMLTDLVHVEPRREGLLRAQIGRAYMRLGDRAIRAGLWDEAERHLLDALAWDPDPARRAAYLGRMVSVFEGGESEARGVAWLEERLAETPGLRDVLEAAMGRLNARVADRAYRAGDYRVAELSYREALLHSEDDRYRINLGMSLRRMDRSAEAIEVWETVAVREDHDGYLYAHLGDAWEVLGNYPEANRWHERAWNIAPGDPRIGYRLAQGHMETGDFSTAIEWAHRVVHDPDLEPTWGRRLASVVIEHAVWDQARSALSGEQPSSAEASLLSYIESHVATEAYQRGDYATAVEHYTQAVTLDVSNYGASRDLGWTYWQMEDWDAVEASWLPLAGGEQRALVLGLLTRLYLRTDRYAEAAAASAEALTLSPGDEDLQLNRARALYWTADYPEARRIASELAERFPENLPIQSLWGELLMQYQDFATGEAQWRHVLDLGSESDRSAYYWVRSMYENGKYAEAIRQAEGFAEAGNLDELLYRLLADDAVMKSDSRSAARWYEGWLALNPDQHGVRVALHRLYLDAGRTEQGIALLREGIDRAKDYPELSLSLGRVLRSEGRYREAERIYREMLARNPSLIGARVGLADTLEAQERNAEAVDLLSEGANLHVNEYEYSRVRAGYAEAAMGNVEWAVDTFTRGQTDRTVYVPSLLYHGIDPHELGQNLPLDRFEDQMRSLRDAGFTAITVQQLVDISEGRMPPPVRPILITFDDARIDAFTRADPVLERYGVEATMFVPIAQVEPGHPFFADWEMIRRYQETGRWDIQAHGYDAHDPITVSPEGDTGLFVTHRKWLPDQARLETPEELADRLRFDYLAVRYALDSEFGEGQTLGYSFPFSDYGQLSFGNVEGGVAPLNVEMVADYYRFAFTQGPSGFSEINPGSNDAPVLLERFTVPRDWDGATLVEHLATHHPRTRSRLDSAKWLYWTGANPRSRVLLEELRLQEPLTAPDTEFYLAAVAYQEGASREALRHLRASMMADTEVRPSAVELMDRIEWSTRPALDTRVRIFSDSNGRTNSVRRSAYTHRFAAPVDLWFSNSDSTFRETGLDDITARELGAGVRIGFARGVEMELEAVRRNFNRVRDTNNAWLRLNLLAPGGEVQLALSQEDLDTVRALEDGIQTLGGSALYRFSAGSLLDAQVRASTRSYDDGNSRRDVRAIWTYRLKDREGWRIGGLVEASDSLFRSLRYYTPRAYLTGQGRVLYQRQWMGWVMESSLGLGIATDSQIGGRIVHNGQLGLNQTWGEKLRANVQFAYSRVPGYQSMSLQAGLEFVIK